MTDPITQEEKSIGCFFNFEAKSMADRHDKSGIPNTAKFQINDILKSEVSSVLDAGSGPGTILINLLENGIDKVTGIDLSPQMNKLAQERITSAGFTGDKFNLIEGSFLDMDQGTFGAVSLHRVLCCHPSKESMLEKSVSFQPKIITITLLRTWLMLRFIIGIYGFYAKLRSKFRPYVHSQKFIDKKLGSLGYELINRNKTLVWVQSTYKITHMEN